MRTPVDRVHYRGARATVSVRDIVHDVDEAIRFYCDHPASNR
jgi:hypothetical protein